MTSELPSEEHIGSLEPVAYFNEAMPTGVTVSLQGRIFVNFPKWGDDVPFTVAEIRDGKTMAYPNKALNQTNENDLAAAFVSVRSEVVKKILFPENVVLPTTYLNDVRFDLRRGSSSGSGGMAFITDSAQMGPNGIIVVDLASGNSWRRLHDHPSTKAENVQTFLPIVEGQPFLEYQPDGSVKQGAGMGSDGIAISSDGSRLYYCPLSSRKLYSVDTDVLADRALDEGEVAAAVTNEGDRGGASDGLESDAAGNIYCTNYEHNAILRRSPDMHWETVTHDPRLLWPDTLSLASDGYLYVTANQLHRQARFHKGRDLRQKPYTLFCVHVDAQPVLLRQ